MIRWPIDSDQTCSGVRAAYEIFYAKAIRLLGSSTSQTAVPYDRLESLVSIHWGHLEALVYHTPNQVIFESNILAN